MRRKIFQPDEPLPRRLTEDLAHRHLDLLIDGLRAFAERTGTLGGPALTFGDLEALEDRSDPDS